MSFKRFDQEDIVVSAESVTAPLWSGDAIELTTFFTSSNQIQGASGLYYCNVYADNVNETSSAQPQFAIAYANASGLGSNDYNTAVPGASPTSTIYGQYRSLVLGDEEAGFVFGEVSSSHFYVLNVDRARYKEKLLPGTLDLTLTYGSTTLHLTDNSNVVDTVTYVDAGRVYELVSGSLGTVHTGTQSNGYTIGSGSYGKFLPDVGVLILNANALEATAVSGGISLGTLQNADNNDNNHLRLLEAMQSGSSFRLNSEETIASNYVFVRARNGEFNYPTNPSLITGSGELRHNVMIDTPQAYITTVGLYNDNNDLLAVAKLSRPLLKDFTKEALIRIKLDY